jgi:phenylalanyl-tRNA synthetase beta chain
LDDRRPFDFFDAKGAVEAVLQFVRAGEYRLEPAEVSYLQPGRSARIVIGDCQAGLLGEIRPDVADAFGIRERTAVFELDLEALRQVSAQSELKFVTPSIYPPSDRDLSLIADESTSTAELQRIVEQAAGHLLESCHLKDVFSGGKIPAGKRSLTFHLVFRSPERTLTEEENTRFQDRILRTVEKKRARLCCRVQ